MKFFFFFFLIFALAFCSKDKNLVDVNVYLNQGKEIVLNKNIDLLNQNINTLNSLDNLDNFKFKKNWSQYNYNARNFLPASTIEIQKKQKLIVGSYQKIISYKNKIVVINRYSEIFIFSSDLKKIKSKKIYNKKIYKNYDLKFDIGIYKDKIYISDNMGNITCLNFKTLKTLWTKKLGVPFRSNVKIYQGNIFVINSNSKIFSINADNGKVNWSFETASKKSKHAYSYRIAIHKNHLYFTNDNGSIFCIDLVKNNIKWSLTFGSENFVTKPLLAKFSPIVIDESNNLYISSNNGNTYSINSNTGALNWSKPIYSLNKYFITKKYLIIVSDSRLIILNKFRGDILYNIKYIDSNVKKNSSFRNILIGKNKIYLFRYDGSIISIDKKNFKNSQTLNILNNFKDFIIDDGNLYILSSNSITKF